MLVDDREEVVVRWRARRTGLAALLVVAGVDPGGLAQPVHAVLTDGDAVLVGELIGDEPVAQCGVVFVDLEDDVEQVGVVPVPLADRVGQPLVVALPGQPQDPQRHRDRHPDPVGVRGAGRGHLSDEREDYFPGRFAWDR